MAKEDRTRADARFNRPGHAKPGKSDYDIANKAVLDNMARLKALRLAREAAEPHPPVVAKKTRAKAKAPGEKNPALSDWLAGQQSGGRRT